MCSTNFVNAGKSTSPFVVNGGVLGFGLGALEMGLGYCIGYTFGGLSK